MANGTLSNVGKYTHSQLSPLTIGLDGVLTNYFLRFCVYNIICDVRKYKKPILFVVGVHIDAFRKKFTSLAEYETADIMFSWNPTI